MADMSIVEYFREHEGHRCGYCGSKDSNYSHGMWAHKMTCQDYQDLIDRGWRRSGKYCYKPDMKKKCCPSYTIRCAALNFHPSKSQKKVMKKVTKYLTVPTQVINPGGSKDGEKTATKTDREDDVEGAVEVSEHPDAAHQKCLGRVKLHGPVDGLSVVSAAVGTSSDSTTGGTKEASSESHNPSHKLQPVSSATSTVQKSRRKVPVQGSGQDPDKPQCRKAKELRRERKEKKLAQWAVDTQVDGEQVQKLKEPMVKSLEEFLIDRIPDQTPVHRLEIKLVRSDNKLTEFRDSFKQSFSVYRKYQLAIHKDPPDECDEIQFKRFLVDSPLVHSIGSDAPSAGFGSFHQQYYIDGKLIAVGVVDILPKCVSSVYFFYDPEFSFLSLGTYSALRELQFTRQLHQECASLNHYYMGFYIHSCPKMKYKGQYEGSELLCPESLRWFPIKNCKPKLDVSNYSRLDDDLDYVPPKATASHASVLFDQRGLPYQLYKMQAGAEDEDEVNEYAELVGPIVAPRMLLFRSR